MTPRQTTSTAARPADPSVDRPTARAASGSGAAAEASRDPGEKSQRDVAAAIGRTVRWVRGLTEEGVFVRRPSRANPRKLVYPWPETLERWIAYRAKLAGGADVDASRTAAKDAQARAAIADATMKEFRLAQLRGEYVERTEYETELRRVLSAIVRVIDLAPGTYAPQLPGDASIAEKVMALRAIMADVRAAMRRAGAPEPESSESREATVLPLAHAQAPAVF